MKNTALWVLKDRIKNRIKINVKIKYKIKQPVYKHDSVWRRAHVKKLAGPKRYLERH